jgi:hypothetical protein
MTSHTRISKPTRGEWQAIVLVFAAAVVWIILFNSLQTIADWLTYGLLALDRDSHLGTSLNFFVYDVPKILLLLSGMIFLITLLRTFVTPEQTRRLLGGRREGVGNVLAAFVGVVTPFCSCSAVPLFIGFVESGIPLGVTLSFLVAAPMVNEVALVMLLGMFGWQVAGLYLISGLMIAVFAGIIIGRLRMERYVEDFVYQVKTRQAASADEPLTWTERFEQALDKTREIIGKVWPYVVAGIAIGAIIHGYVPEDALAQVMGSHAWWSVPAAVVLGVPLYSNAAGVIPIVSALLGKGAALGTALAFMMSVVALSLPEIIILRRVLKPRLIALYIGVVTFGIIVIGYLFNMVMS